MKNRLLLLIIFCLLGTKLSFGQRLHIESIKIDSTIVQGSQIRCTIVISNLDSFPFGGGKLDSLYINYSIAGFTNQVAMQSHIPKPISINKPQFFDNVVFSAPASKVPVGPQIIVIWPTGTGNMYNNDTLSKPITVLANTSVHSSKKKENTVSVFPNPSTNFISVNSFLPIKRVAIFSMEGRQLLSTDHDFDSIDLGSIPYGIYEIELTLVNGQKLTRRLVRTP